MEMTYFLVNIKKKEQPDRNWACALSYPIVFGDCGSDDTDGKRLNPPQE
jgi:hypothetical protein